MDDKGLLTTSVPRSLDTKNKLFGFELPDLLFIFMNLAITNLIFGSSSYRYSLVWGSTSLIAASLFFLKKDKPDNYIQHLGEYIAQGSIKLAGKSDLKYRPLNAGENNETI